MVNRNDQYLRQSWRLLMGMIWLTVIGCIILLGYLLTKDMIDYFPPKETISTNPKRPSLDKVERNFVVNGIHVPTGLVYDQDFELVRATCTACHSSKLVTQNKATREGWQQMIDWMQETQGLWELGKQEPVIVEYLARHYGPQKMGRRANLDMEEIEWYVLELDN